uniref:Uncharacterized protein n=1 Tax=Trichobilharzia regenti TaxID=157069 RepID=A0AA85J2T8_TRIRE|nr:unnamed protein product [Trichobilharzia regenti]
MFGRGSLVKIGNATSALINGPWNLDVLDNNQSNISVPLECSSHAEYIPTNTVNMLSLVNEREANISILLSDNDPVSQNLLNCQSIWK